MARLRKPLTTDMRPGFDPKHVRMVLDMDLPEYGSTISLRDLAEEIAPYHPEYRMSPRRLERVYIDLLQSIRDYLLAAHEVRLPRIGKLRLEVRRHDFRPRVKMVPSRVWQKEEFGPREFEALMPFRQEGMARLVERTPELRRIFEYHHPRMKLTSRRAKTVLRRIYHWHVAPDDWMRLRYQDACTQVREA